MTRPSRPTLAITMGDPFGIGPEVVVKSLADPALRRLARYHIFGAASSLHDAAQKAGIDPFWWRLDHDSDLIETTAVHDVVLLDYERPSSPPRPAPPFIPTPSTTKPSRIGGELSFRFVEDAIAAAKLPPKDPRHVAGLVTAPISKKSWDLAGRGAYPGHTELLAVRFGAKRCCMMFDSPNPPHLRVVLATVHIPLMDIRNALTIGVVFDAIDLGNDACKQLGIAQPRIAVCGLNPHAGEEGLFGDEETRLIEPAIRAAQDAGIDARGPFPGDTIFSAAAQGKYDLVVAMYHDQGLIPIKLLAFDSAVNMTIGLPTIRTSPDHGTAFDIAGHNKASATSMSAAIRLAARLAAREDSPQRHREELNHGDHRAHGERRTQKAQSGTQTNAEKGASA